MGLGHSPRIVTDGLVLCLDAANARSYPGTGTTWTDRSGNGNDGTLINGPTFSDENGGVLYLMVLMTTSVQIYNRALTSEEVRQNFEATKGRYE
jgi:hypothetical protein